VQEVAAHFGISAQRVSQIIRRHGRRLSRATRREEAMKEARVILANHVRNLAKQADELIAAESTKSAPGLVAEPTPEPTPDPVLPPDPQNVADLLPDVAADASVDELLAAAECEIERRTAPKGEEPEFEPASYDSKELLACEREWLSRVLPSGLTPETSTVLAEAYQMAKAAKIPRGSPRYFQFMTLRSGLTNKR
jgi:hypothetical protein